MTKVGESADVEGRATGDWRLPTVSSSWDAGRTTDTGSAGSSSRRRSRRANRAGLGCGLAGGRVPSLPDPPREDGAKKIANWARLEPLAEHLGRGTAADLLPDHERPGGVARGLEFILEQAADHRGRRRPLLGGLADERAAVEGLGDGRVLALGVDLLLELGSSGLTASACFCSQVLRCWARASSICPFSARARSRSASLASRADCWTFRNSSSCFSSDRSRWYSSTVRGIVGGAGGPPGAPAGGRARSAS